MATGVELAPSAVPDTGAFAARLVRLDPAALIRLRPVSQGVVELWGRLPFDVLASRRVRTDVPEDIVVAAADLLTGLERGEPRLPARADLGWRSPLPPDPGEPLETVPAAELRRIAQAAATTLRAASGRGVGERRLRDELLDHVALVVTEGDLREEVPLRLVQGAVRMGFLPDDGGAPVRVRRARGWLALQATYGTVWYRTAATLRISPVRN